MPEPAPLWERREQTHDDSWFHAVKYPLAGAWYPVRWQGLLLLVVEGLLLFFVFGDPANLQTRLAKAWRDWLVWSEVALIVIGFALAIVKTRWRWG